MTKFVRHLVRCIAIGAAVAATNAPASARTVYDGVWSVLVITEAGTCDRAYRYPVEIVNGRLRHASEGDASFIIAGRVQPGGTVSVSVSRGDQRASGAGRLSRSDGAGLWSAPSGPCSGRWIAERRG
jgi:hypothetical protein